ncbi:ABC transporter permease [Puia sp.]|uniref:ABC transporter permease n=1 Tax=Puia sp. TaxID=2045100 RepID=UPI002F410B74
MLGTYFKTAWRNILRGKLYSVLNILGLATGMAVALVIGLWVNDQLSNDRWIPGYQQAYQVRFRFSDNGVMRSQEDVSLPVGDALKRDIPEVAYVAPAFHTGGDAVLVNDKRVEGLSKYVGAEFLQVFPFPLLEGDAATALKEPGSVVISESMARAVFGKASALNKTIRMVSMGPRKITAVVKNLPRNSSFQFDFLLPFKEFASGGWVQAATTRWGDAYFTMYAALKPGADVVKAQQKISQLVRHYSPETWTSFHREPVLFAMKDWHLYTEFKDGYPSGGLIDYVRLFSIVGVLVLLIACINFMNLSTARSEKRAKEVGVRKVIGSSRKGLIFQFLVESLTMTFLAFLLALAAVQMVLPAFTAMTGEVIRIPWNNGLFWMIMIGYVVVTGLLAGSRPAFYLSSFQPVKVLKGMKIGKAAALPRKVLVVLQFTCSIALIISTVIVYQQIQYAKDRPRGYDPSRLVVISNPGDSYGVYKQEVLRSGVVTAMTRSLTSASEVHGHNIVDQWPGMLSGEAFAPVLQAVADSDYFKTHGIGFLEGRNFSGNFGADSTCVIFNEAAVQRMRLKQPLNAYVHWPSANAPERLRVIGVVRNIVTNNPFGTPDPTIYVFQPGWTWAVTCRVAPNVSTRAALEKMRDIYGKYVPGEPFGYSFVDDNYASHFALETMIGKLAGVFAGLAIFISCLGLFGLAAYMAEQRTKEIGIRKVLGASVGQVMVLLSGDFLFLVGVSCVIASPIAYYFLHQWLAGYYYRIAINPLVFVAAGVLAVTITAITVGFQSIRSALMNPVTSLRSE